MRFNAQGQVAHGNEFGQSVSVDNVAVAGGAALTWIGGDVPGRAVFMRNEDAALALYDHATRTVTLLDARGANTLRAGGGVWAASKVGTGLYASGGLFLPDCFLLDVGPDGAIAYTPLSGFPVVVRQRDGSEWTLAQHPVLDLQLLGDGRAVWREGTNLAARGVALQAPRLQCWRPRVARVAQRDYVAVFTDGHGLAVYPADNPALAVLVPGVDPWHAFSHDMRAIDDRRVEVVWFPGEGERPGELQRATLDVIAGPFVDVLVSTPTPTPQPTHPTPQPTPTPIPEPAMPDIPPALHDQLALVTEVRNTLFPSMVGKPLNDPKKAFAITTNVAWRLREHGVGLVKAKEGSLNNVDGFTSDVVALANGVHWDVLADGNEGASFPNWSMEENPANYPPIAARWTPAIDPGGVTPVDPATPTPSAVALQAQIATEVAKAIAPLQAEIAALKTMLAQRWPAPGTTVRVALKSTHGKYVSIDPTGRIVADRDAVGPWETLNVEPQ